MPPARKKPGPDDRLAPESFAEVNEEFYGRSPTTYFEYRAMSIMLAAGAWDALEKLVAEGVTVGKVRLVSDASKDTETDDSEERQGAVLTDACVLFHHAAETLVRLYLAHADRSPCPALAVARERTPGKFKARVTSEILEPDYDDLRPQVGYVFLGGSDPSELGLDVERPAWDAEIDRFSDWLKFFAARWLGEAPLYNAAKHGLGLTGGQGAVSMGDEESPVLDTAGGTISYFEVMESDTGPRWSRSLQFLEIDELLTAVRVAVRLMGQLFKLASHRYVNGPTPAVGPVPILLDKYVQAVDGDRPPIFARKMSMSLSYYVDDSQQDLAARTGSIDGSINPHAPVEAS